MILANPRPHGPRTVVALGGGGARGLAHLGAVQAIHEAGYAIDRLVGTSIGSLVGALIASEPILDQGIQKVVSYLESDDFRAQQEALCGAHPKPGVHENSGLLAWYDRIRSYLWTRHLLSRVFRRRSLLSGKVLEEVIAELVPDIDISDTRIPLSIVTVDLKTGHQIVLEQGSLRQAVRASAAIPGIFPPVEWDDLLLCDFGVLDSLPSRVARGYEHEVAIGVDVGPSLEPIEDCPSALHVLLRMDEISERICRRFAQRELDILIQPDVGRFEWFDFSKPTRLIEAGLAAGRESLRRANLRRGHHPIPGWQFRCQTLLPH